MMVMAYLYKRGLVIPDKLTSPVGHNNVIFNKIIT